MNTSINLLGTTSRVETPAIGVKIGDYVLGTYGYIEHNKTQFIINPKYLKSLNVKKINGTVNTYVLRLDYPIRQGDDPNYIDKIFSSISKTRSITFSYGDVSTPAFIYKEETAIVTRVKKKSNVSASVKEYTVYAVSSGAINTIGAFKFRKRREQPSKVIKEILYEPKYGLTQVFFGMTDRAMVEAKKLIRDDDAIVDIEAKSNISVLDYLSYLVDCMRPASSYNNLNSNKVKDDLNKLLNKSFYVLLFEDGIADEFTGPYFRIERSDKLREKSSAYEIDIGYPSQNIVTSFDIDDDETYSIYYEFAQKLQNGTQAPRINDQGQLEDVFAPSIASNTPRFKTTEELKSWWTKVTQYPIKATLTFKGLLRPAVLMSYVRLNIYYWGAKDIDSGLYIVLSQQDNIDMGGYRTTLKLLRVGGDDTYAN